MPLRQRRPARAEAAPVIRSELRVALADGRARTIDCFDDLPKRQWAAQIVRLRPPATPTFGLPGSAWRYGGMIAGAAEDGAGHLAAAGRSD